LKKNHGITTTKSSDPPEAEESRWQSK